MESNIVIEINCWMWSKMHDIDPLGALQFIVLFLCCSSLGIILVSIENDGITLGCGIVLLCIVPIWIFIGFYTGLFEQIYMKCRYNDEERHIARQFISTTLPLWEETLERYN